MNKYHTMSYVMSHKNNKYILKDFIDNQVTAKTICSNCKDQPHINIAFANDWHLTLLKYYFTLNAMHSGIIISKTFMKSGLRFI